jgi:hypothetical protein
MSRVRRGQKLLFTSMDNIDSITVNLSTALRNAHFENVKWRAPPRADELVNSLGHDEAVWHRLERAAAGDIEVVWQEARRALVGLTTTQIPRPAYGDLLAVVVAFRNLSAWGPMIHFIEKVSARYSRDGVSFALLHPVAQQYGMALNRQGLWLKAENSLITLIEIHGPDAESLGILGRVYKDRWRRSRAATDLLRSINAYAGGLLANPGELYPAINLATLLRAAGAASSGFEAVATHLWKVLDERRRVGPGDYFDYATAVEFHTLLGRNYEANLTLDEALQRLRAPWELETTAANLTILLGGNRQTQISGFIKTLIRRLRAEAARNRS